MAASTHTFEENLAAATEHLARFRTNPVEHLIGGKARASASGATTAAATAAGAAAPASFRKSRRFCPVFASFIVFLPC